MRSFHCTQNKIKTRSKQNLHQVEGWVIIYEILTASTARARRLFHLAPPLHGSNSDIGHVLAISAGGVTPEISFKLVTKAVLGLAHGDCCSHPEGPTQPCVAVLRDISGAAKLGRLLCRQIEATELGGLAMMAEAAQIAGFSQDGECWDGTNAGDLL